MTTGIPENCGPHSANTGICLRSGNSPFQSAGRLRTGFPSTPMMWALCAPSNSLRCVMISRSVDTRYRNTTPQYFFFESMRQERMNTGNWRWAAVGQNTERRDAWSPARRHNRRAPSTTRISTRSGRPNAVRRASKCRSQRTQDRRESSRTACRFPPGSGSQGRERPAAAG